MTHYLESVLYRPASHTSPWRGALLALLLTIFACTQPGSILHAGTTNPDAATSILFSLPQRTPGYPLIANYNGFNATSDVPAFASYSMVIAPQTADQGRPSPLQFLRIANPHAVLLMYQRTLQVDYPLIRQYYGNVDIFPGWWLLRAGSLLTTPLTASQTRIPVADSSRFRQYDDVLVGAETMHVLAVRTGSLLVQRGFYSRASTHPAGTRIAAHYSYRVDLRNNIITGKHENRRPWSFNLSTLCPRDAQGRTWNDFLAGYLATLLHDTHWNGVFLDNTDELLRDPWVDVNNDNQPDGGVLTSDNVWHDGEMYLLHRLHTLVPWARIMDNGTLDAGHASNGRELENFPLSDGFYMSSMSDYTYWQRHDAQPSLTLVNPDSNHLNRFNLGAMRFGLASALLGDGYYTYDEGWHKHGVVWNFDEYDGAMGSALLRDIGPQDTYIPVRHTFRFHVGDLIVVGRELMRVVDLGSWNLIVHRGIGGTQPTTHPSGTVVATPNQLAAGSGYLGQPLGAAYALITAPQSPNLILNGSFAQAGYGWQLWLGARQWRPTSAGITIGNMSNWRPVALGGTLRPLGSARSHAPRAYSISLPWQTLREPEDVSLIQDNVKVLPRTPYTLSFWAHGVSGMSLPILLSGVRPGWHIRYATFAVTLHQGWYRYMLRYTSPAQVQRLQIAFQLGHTYGQTAVTGVTLQRGQSLVYARAFQHGLVLLNQCDQAQRISLPRTYWHLNGDQDPTVNTGMPVRTLALPPHAGLILLSEPPQQ